MMIQRLMYTFISSLTVLMLMTSCGTRKYVAEGEYLLEENKVVFTEKVPHRGDLAYELSTLYQQKANTNWFLSLVPREWFYFKTKDKNRGWHRFLRKNFGEEPAIYRDTLAKATARDMATYLHYNGYLNAEVLPQRSDRRHKMHVNYYVSPGELFFIDSVNYSSPDPVIDSLLQKSSSASNFKEGEPLRFNLFGQEKKRLTAYLRNHGFADFSQNSFADLEVDTSQTPKRANLYMTVNPPYGFDHHQQYFVGDITVYQDYSDDDSNIVGDTLIGGIRFLLSERGFVVNPAVFRSAISLRLGEVYKESDLDRTEAELRDLGIFRFVRLKPYTDTIQPDVKHFNILLTPNYKLEFSAGVQANYTNRSSANASGNLMGLSFSPGFRNRNLFGGAEVFSTSLSSGIEVAWQQLGTSEFWNTVDLRAEFNLGLPKFQDYLGIWRRIHRTWPAGKKKVRTSSVYTKLRDKATTRISASYNYLLIFNWYRYNLLNLSYGYDLRTSRYERYTINHMAVNVLNPITEPLFDERQAQNEFLQRSFGQQVFVSFLFRGIDYEKQSRTTARGRSTYYNINFETAGGELFGLNKLYNAISGDDTAWALGRNRDINFSQYIKLDYAWHYNKQVNDRQSFAGRFNLGIARPFGNTDDVPYVKQFFVGGANSMRAWNTRGLGPGGYVDTLSFDPKAAFRLFQTGDLKLELNAEYRFPIFSIFNGALFIDAGNIWTVEPDATRPGSQFILRTETRQDSEGKDYVHYPFYKQMAVAGGLGLRIDASYVVLRFDFGVKLRFNAPTDPEVINPPESLWWNDFREFDRQDYGFGLGLGVPF